MAFLFFQKCDPVAVDRNSVGVPGVFDAGTQRPHRKFANQFAMGPAFGTGAKVVGEKHRGAVEIILRRLRIGASLAAQETADVAAVFAQQRIGIVFRMALKEDKQRPAVLLLDEGIGARRRRTAEHTIPAGSKWRFRQIVEPRMRHALALRHAGQERMIASRLAIEHAGSLSLSRSRTMPSEYCTAACAARHDQTADMVL